MHYKLIGTPRPFKDLPLGWFEGAGASIYYKASTQTISLEKGDSVELDPNTPCTPVSLI